MRGKDRGFTLVEVIISVAVLSIVLAMLGGIFSSSSRLNRRANDSYNAQSDAQSLMTLIQNEIRYANSVAVTGEAPAGFGGGKRYIYAEGGSVVRNAGPAAGDARSMIAGTSGFSYGVEFKKSSPKSLGVKVTVTSGGKELYELQTDVYINNLMSSSVSGESGGTVGYTVPSE